MVLGEEMATPATGKRILWVDNDPGYIKPYVLSLEGEGYSVTVATSVTQAEEALKRDTFGLLILDVMIPTVSAQEELHYPPEETDKSFKTGLVLFRREKENLAKKGIPVFVMTVRIDKEVRKEFLAEGLPTDRYSTKMELRDTPTFIAKIKSLLS